MAEKLSKGQTRFLSGNNPKLRINLEELFDISFSGKDSLKQAIGQAIIDKIHDNTADSKFLPGSSRKGYSKSYKDSDDFNAAGKTNKVNLTLSGDMLELMDIIDETENTITIGWNDEDEAAKAHGHITGGGFLPKRDFLGLSASDIESLVAEFSSDLEAVRSARGEEKDDAILSFIGNLSRANRDG